MKAIGEGGKRSKAGRPSPLGRLAELATASARAALSARPMTYGELASVLCCSERTARRHVATLVSRKLARVSSRSKGGPNRIAVVSPLKRRSR